MQFGFWGISHKKAPLDIRDKVSFTDRKTLQFFRRAEDVGVHQCMVLSTCNRSEVYFFYDGEDKVEGMRQIYKEMFPETALATSLDTYLVGMTGEDAIGYLFRVAAGFESLVIGEDQILGQVKEALEFSRTMGYSGKELNRTVCDAITCAKRIKTELKISDRPLSVSYIGIQMLDRHCGIEGKRVLVIGSGKTAALALRYLREYRAGRVTACSRTFSHAGRLRKEFPDIGIVEYEGRYGEMKECDIVISATTSPHLVVRRAEFKPERPVTFLDLASPRDIDTAFSEDRLVHRIDLDTLQKIAGQNEKERQRLVEKSQSLIDEEIEKTGIWLHQSRVDSTIQSLQQRCQEIVEDSYGYLNRKMVLGQREQKLLRKVLNASLQRLLKEPIQELKQIDSQEKQDKYKEMIDQLFRI